MLRGKKIFLIFSGVDGFMKLNDDRSVGVVINNVSGKYIQPYRPVFIVNLFFVFRYTF